VSPPLVGVAVKVTLVPEQIVLPGLADMLTLAVAPVPAVTGIWFDELKHGPSTVAGKVIDQLSIDPTSTPARSYALSNQFPFGLIDPPPIAPKVVIVVVTQVDTVKVAVTGL
jgi:hypothetical protein